MTRILFSGVSVDYGLTDYVSTMALPARVWTDWTELPRLYSWNDAARDELLALFNYDNELWFRGLLSLKEVNFETFDLPSRCDKKNNNMTEYCKLSKILPNLKVTMDMMNLASSPLNFESKLKQNLK